MRVVGPPRRAAVLVHQRAVGGCLRHCRMLRVLCCLLLVWHGVLARRRAVRGRLCRSTGARRRATALCLLLLLLRLAACVREPDLQCRNSIDREHPWRAPLQAGLSIVPLSGHVFTAPNLAWTHMQLSM